MLQAVDYLVDVLSLNQPREVTNEGDASALFNEVLHRLVYIGDVNSKENRELGEP